MSAWFHYLLTCWRLWRQWVRQQNDINRQNDDAQGRIDWARYDYERHREED